MKVSFKIELEKSWKKILEKIAIAFFFSTVHSVRLIYCLKWRIF
jgi:hypothetical protein